MDLKAFLIPNSRAPPRSIAKPSRQLQAGGNLALLHPRAGPSPLGPTIENSGNQSPHSSSTVPPLKEVKCNGGPEERQGSKPITAEGSSSGKAQRRGHRSRRTAGAANRVIGNCAGAGCRAFTERLRPLEPRAQGPGSDYIQLFPFIHSQVLHPMVAGRPPCLRTMGGGRTEAVVAEPA